MNRRRGFGTMFFGLCLAVGAAGCNQSARPLTPASPQQVVEGYLDAIAIHQPMAAKALMTPSYLTTVEHNADDLLTNARSLTDIVVGTGVSVGTHPPSVYVPVHFVISQYKVGGWDNGPVTFGYTLVRSNSSHLWLINGGGTG